MEEVALDLESGGFAPLTKLGRRRLPRWTARASAREPRVVLEPFFAPGRRGVFEADQVRIEDRDGSVVSERRDPRAAFGGRRALWWDRLDLLHFAGYALWGYATEPFLFAREGFRVHEIEPWDEAGERRRRLAVTFPAGIPAHSREQVFHLDEAGRIRRIDYTAEVFGSWARAAHYCDGHRDFDGLLVPTRRRVYLRLPSGRPLRFPTIIWIDVLGVEVTEGVSAGGPG